MTIKSGAYSGVKHQGTDGTLQLSSENVLTFRPEKGGAEILWNVSTLRECAVQTSKGRDRHWIKLALGGEERPAVFELSTREEVERLRRNLSELTTPPATNPQFSPAAATATPIGSALRGSGIEDDVPVVTNVILIPHEDDEEEIDLREKEEPQGILASLRPAPTPPLASIRFWDRDGQGSKPASGDGLQDGCPHSCWLIVWFLSTILLFVTVGTGVSSSLRTEDDPLEDDDKLTVPAIIMPSVFFALLYLIFLCTNFGGCCDNSIMYLRNTKTSTEAEKKLKDNIKNINPKVHINVRCYHEETRQVKDREGGYTTETKTVTTFNHNFPVNFVSCTDQTDYDHVNLHKYKLTKVKVLKSLVPDETFWHYQRKLHDENRYRDVHCEVTEGMELDGYEPCSLCIAEGASKPCMLNVSSFVICHLLVVPALPYRLWMGHITGKMNVELRKAIQTDPALLSAA